MAVLDRAGFLSAAATLPREAVTVPELGGTVYIGTMTGAERERWESLVINQSEGHIRAVLIAQTAQDESGNKLFTADDVPAIAALRCDVLVRLFAVAQRLNALRREDIAELGKA